VLALQLEAYWLEEVILLLSNTFLFAFQALRKLCNAAFTVSW